MMNRTNLRMKKSNLRISLLALLFGMGSWIAITGLWLEMPLLIQKLPEGWRLASHLNIMFQFANIGPLIYWYAHRKRGLNEVSATHIQMLVGMISCLGLILGWNRTMVLYTHEHSIVLFVATFGLALVDCTSSVTFLPFMARFDSSYMTPYLVGEGLSGFIPSMVALVQGVGDNRKECSSTSNNVQPMMNITIQNISSLPSVYDPEEMKRIPNESIHSKLIEPRFSVEVFFFSLFATIFISYVSFCALQWLPICQREMNRIKQRRQSQLFINSTDSTAAKLKHNRHSITYQAETNSIEIERDDDDIETRMKDITTNALMCWNCFTTFGFFPSVQPYSALPYGVEVLHYVVILSGLAYPAGCFFGMLVENKSLRIINLLTIIGSCIGFYILVCALMSPSPPLLGTSFGGVLMIVAWISFVGILSYAKTMITLWICEYATKTGMFWLGMNTQFGAATGAALNFILINYSRLYNEC